MKRDNGYYIVRMNRIFQVLKNRNIILNNKKFCKSKIIILRKEEWL